MFKGEICFFYSIIILVGVVNVFLYTLIDRPVSTLPGSENLNQTHLTLYGIVFCLLMTCGVIWYKVLC